jgi:hypothetical protein
MADRLKALERENRELRQANEILRKASAYFAQAELDRPRTWILLKVTRGIGKNHRFIVNLSEFPNLGWMTIEPRWRDMDR